MVTCKLIIASFILAAMTPSASAVCPCENSGTCKANEDCECLTSKWFKGELFEGDRCEVYDLDGLLAKYFKQEKGLTVCTAANGKNCSAPDPNAQGTTYACPNIDCCYPKDGEIKILRNFTTGKLKGCPVTEECVKTGPPTCFKELPPGEAAECTRDPCTEIRRVPYEKNCPLIHCDGKCHEDICAKKECPAKPEPDHACQEVVEDATKEHECVECKHWTKKSKFDCGDLCDKSYSEGEQCIRNCVDWTPRRPCSPDCSKPRGTTIRKIPNTCKYLQPCVHKTCEELIKETGVCHFSGETVPDRNECKCEVNDEIQEISEMTHCVHHCKKLQCKPKPPVKCPEEVTSCGKHRKLVPYDCSPEQEIECKALCDAPKECVCENPVERCEEPEVLAKKDCPADCGQCCDVLCVPDPEAPEKKITYTCKEPKCEVCAGDEGAKLAIPNMEYCNSDKQCCKSACRPAKEVEECPADWTEKRKEFCECRFALVGRTVPIRKH